MLESANSQIENWLCLRPTVLLFPLRGSEFLIIGKILYTVWRAVRRKL